MLQGELSAYPNYFNMRNIVVCIFIPDSPCELTNIY